MKQTTTTLSGHTIHMVEVPKDVIKIVWEKSNEGRVLWAMRPELYTGRFNPEFMRSKRMNLPDGIWKLLGLSSEIPEEIAARYVAKVYDSPRLYADYQKPQGLTHMQASSAVESLHSFVKAHHYNPPTTVILIKE